MDFPSMRKTVIIFGVFLFLSPFIAKAYENSYTANYVVPSSQSGYATETYEAMIPQKVERGLKNFFLGWLEVPHGIKSEIYYRKQEYLPVSLETYALGTFKGFFNAAGRTAVGFFEVFTFPFPNKPILEDMDEWLY